MKTRDNIRCSSCGIISDRGMIRLCWRCTSEKYGSSVYVPPKHRKQVPMPSESLSRRTSDPLKWSWCEFDTGLFNALRDIGIVGEIHGIKIENKGMDLDNHHCVSIRITVNTNSPAGYFTTVFDIDTSRTAAGELRRIKPKIEWAFETIPLAFRQVTKPLDGLDR